MPLHDSNLASLLLRRWCMEETWAVPQPFLDHFVGGYIFCGVIHMLFQGESFCLPKCFWSLCKPSCQPKCSHTCSHCYSYHLAVNKHSSCSTKESLVCQAFKLETHHEQSVCRQFIFDTNDHGLSYSVSHPVILWLSEHNQFICNHT